jgi:L-alanine-DL-glutamate epimerase-like enolase superfamily enzyme
MRYTGHAPLSPVAFPFAYLRLELVSGLGGNESYPDLFQPFGGFPDGVKVVDSYVTLPDLPGIGFEGKADLYREMKALSD